MQMLTSHGLEHIAHYIWKVVRFGVRVTVREPMNAAKCKYEHMCCRNRATAILVFKGWLNKITIATRNLLKLHSLSPHWGNTHSLVHSMFYIEIWSIAEAAAFLLCPFLFLFLCVCVLLLLCALKMMHILAYDHTVCISVGLFTCLFFQSQQFSGLSIYVDKNIPTKPQNIDKHRLG